VVAPQLTPEEVHLLALRTYLPRPRAFQPTLYRPGEILQFDLWEPGRGVPVGHGQTRRGFVVVAALGYSRAGAGTLVFSKEAPDVLAGLWRCLGRLGAPPKTLVCEREGLLHAGGGRPSEPFARFCGQLRIGWHICAPGDPQAKGLVERLIGFLETGFEPGREFVGPLHFQDQLDRCFDERANRRLHLTLRRRPVNLLAEEHERMRPLPADGPDTDRRIVTRVPPDPHLRVDTNDYSLDPGLVGRRVELRVSQRQVLAVALATGEVACRRERCFARHRTRTRPRLEGGPPPRPGRARGRDPAAGPLRPADPGMSSKAELTHLFRSLKAPAAARALPKLADRGRQEEWSDERFAEGLLSTRDRALDQGLRARLPGRVRYPREWVMRVEAAQERNTDWCTFQFLLT
jgi:hypothetical protein